MTPFQRIADLYRHPAAALGAYVLVVALAVGAFGVAFTSIRHLSDTQQRVTSTQQRLVLTTARLDRETSARLQSVCDVALDNRQVVRQVVAVIESGAPPDSALRDPAVVAELDELLQVRPVVCPSPPLEEGSQG